MNEGTKIWTWTEPNEEDIAHIKDHGSIGCVKHFSKVHDLAINTDDLLAMPPGLIHAGVTKSDSLGLGLHFELHETLKPSVDFAKEDIADGKKHQTNEESRIRNAGKAFYLELLNVYFLNAFS